MLSSERRGSGAIQALQGKEVSYKRRELMSPAVGTAVLSAVVACGGFYLMLRTHTKLVRLCGPQQYTKYTKTKLIYTFIFLLFLNLQTLKYSKI